MLLASTIVIVLPLLGCLEPLAGRLAQGDARRIATDAETIPPNAPDVDDAPDADDAHVVPGDTLDPGDELPQVQPCDGTGLTWRLQVTDAQLGIQRVGCWDGCDAYYGDTPCTESRPMLCFRELGEPSPEGPVGPDEYWSGGQIALTPAQPGCSLTSLEVADARCAELFGAGWRMAEFHDGWGWHFWALGAIATESRFWVFIDDQRANCFPTPGW